jgi:hypothetical protein
MRGSKGRQLEHSTFWVLNFNLRQLTTIMILGVLKEPSPETRVSLHPEAVKNLVAAGNKVQIEKGAGEASFLSDELYKEAGAGNH